MAYYIFSKNSDNIQGTIYRIAENQFDLDNLNIDKLNYTILENNEVNFDEIKSNTKNPYKYANNIVYFENLELIYFKFNLQNYITDLKFKINSFLTKNKDHLKFNQWNQYYNQLNSLNLDSIAYPLNTSLEKYFKDNNLSYFNILQIP